MRGDLKSLKRSELVAWDVFPPEEVPEEGPEEEHTDAYAHVGEIDVIVSSKAFSKLGGQSKPKEESPDLDWDATAMATTKPGPISVSTLRSSMRAFREDNDTAPTTKSTAKF